MALDEKPVLEAAETSDELVERVLGGNHPQLARLAAEGVLPLTQEQLVGLQIKLAEGAPGIDQATSEIARDSLEGLSVSSLVEFIRHDAASRILGFFFRPGTNPALVEAAIQRRGVSPKLLASTAPSLDERAQEVLLLRQDLILEHPEILEALATNPRLTSYSRRLIGEYRQHLLAPKVAPEPQPAPELGEGELTPEEAMEVQEAIAEVIETVSPEGEYDERTGLTEGQVRMLTLPVRVKLARGAGRTLRGILIRDPNPQVAVGVLKESAFTEAEAEIVSANRYVCAEVLTELSLRRSWIGKYQVLHNVVKNPRTPVPTAVKLLPRLSVRDLGLLRRDRNVPEAVRQMAVRLHVTRSR